jgi:pSer/pThr/pTyr-binding forkhead associated (FHA) protein
VHLEVHGVGPANRDGAREPERAPFGGRPDLVQALGRRESEDLGSHNGTFIGASRVTIPTALRDGDVVRVGSVALTFRNMLAPGSTDTLG